MSTVDEFGRDAACAAANIQYSVGVLGNVIQEKLGIAFLGGCQVSGFRFQSFSPIPVVQIARTKKMTTGKKPGG